MSIKPRYSLKQPDGLARTFHEIVEDTPQVKQARLAITEFPEYNMRDVVTLKPISQWDERETNVHLQENRLLQSEVFNFKPNDLISMATHAKEDWLTDFICPKIDHAVKLNIAAELISKYKVSPDDLDDVVHRIDADIKAKHATLYQSLGMVLNLHMAKPETNEVVMRNAEAALQRKYPDLKEDDPDYDEILISIQMVEYLREAKKKTHELVQQSIDPLVAEAAVSFDIQPKPIPPEGENRDLSILGAAGSGKSTISRQFITDDEKLDYVILATDDYRGVTLDDESEVEPSKQIFVRTQDSAYCIKELVAERMMREGARPNVLVDCVSLEGWHRQLLSQSKEVVSAVACLDDINLVPERAYNRAIQSTNPADRGRHVNTTALVKGHALASQRLLTSIPDDVQTTLYDTNVARESKPNVMGVIDTTEGKHTLDVYMIDRMCNFLGKARANEEATFSGNMYRDESRQKNRFTYDTHFRAEALLSTIKPSPPFQPNAYDILLKDSAGESYAKIYLDDANQFKMDVLDKQKFLQQINQKNESSQLLQSMVMQIHYQGLEPAREKMFQLGKLAAATQALKAVAEVESVPHSMRKRSDSTFLFQEHNKKEGAGSVSPEQRRAEMRADIAKRRKSLQRRSEVEVPERAEPRPKVKR